MGTSRAVRAGVITAAIFLLPACKTTQATGRSPGEPRMVLPVQHLDGSTAEINLLARKLLIGGEPVPRQFAYYCYLLFTDRSSDTEAARRSAASAYLRLLSDVGEAKALVPPEHMALLLAPVRDDKVATTVLAQPNVDVLLDGYGYDRARLILGKLRPYRDRIPRVSIIGYPVPLEGASDLDPHELRVVDLDVKDGTKTEARVLKLRDELEANRTDIDVQGEPKALRLARGFFELIGYSVADAHKATGT